MTTSSGTKENAVSRETYPAKSRYKGQVAKEYLQSRIRSRKWQREQQVIERLVGTFPRGSSILDVPLGTGRFLQYYATHNHTVYGLDISNDMLSQAGGMQRGVHKTINGKIQGDAESIPLRDGAVDYVICMRLLNFIPSSILTEIISEFKRIARKGLIVEVRVKEPIGLLSMINQIVADPRPIINRLMHPLYSRAMTGLKILLRAFTTKAIIVNGHKPAGDKTEGYVIHNADEVARMFAAQCLVVHDVIEIDKGIDCRQRRVMPLLVMCCSKGRL